MFVRSLETIKSWYLINFSVILKNFLSVFGIIPSDEITFWGFFMPTKIHWMAGLKENGKVGNI